jgi:NADP-dependent 3-hydroxy acid dehydrogenase YdfG
MSKILLICGYGTGISAAVAKLFGKEGFQLALVARNESKLSSAVAELAQEGISAHAFVADLSDANAVRNMIEQVRSELGAITVIHWNPYSNAAGDLIAAPTTDLQTNLNVAVTGLVAAVQAALPDLKASKESAVLISGGGLATYSPQIDLFSTQFKVMGLAVAKAAQHKLAGLLTAKLAKEGVYVGEVFVTGMVKGTAFDSGNATLEPSTIASKFYELYTTRSVNTLKL